MTAHSSAPATTFLSVCCAVLAASGLFLRAQQATGKEDVDLSNSFTKGQSTSKLEQIKWNADFSKKGHGSMTVVLDLASLSPLDSIRNVTVIVGLYRNGKLIKTSQFPVHTKPGIVLTGGSKYATDIPLTVKCDSIKPVRLNGTIEPLVYADQIDRTYHPPA